MTICEINKRRKVLKENLAEALRIREEAAQHADTIAGELDVLNQMAVVAVGERVNRQNGKTSIK